MNILDKRFKYTPAVKTSVADTFRKFGFKPTTEAERKARQQPKPSNVTALGTRRKRQP